MALRIPSCCPGGVYIASGVLGGPSVWAGMLPGLIPYLWVLIVPPASALIFALLFNLLASHFGPLVVSTAGGMALRPRLAGDEVEPERVEIRGLGLIFPSLLCAALAMGTVLVLAIVLMVEGNFTGERDSLVAVLFCLFISLALGFILGVFAMFICNAACRFLAGLRVVVE